MFRLLTDTFAWIGIVILVLIAILAKGELNELQGKSKAQEKVIKGLELQLRDQEWKLFRTAEEVEKYTAEAKEAKERIEKLGDKILDACLTDSPRPLKKSKGKKGGK